MENTTKSCGCRPDVECIECCSVTCCYVCGAAKPPAGAGFPPAGFVLGSNWNGEGWDRAGICSACRADGAGFVDRPRQRRPRRQQYAYGDYAQLCAFVNGRARR